MNCEASEHTSVTLFGQRLRLLLLLAACMTVACFLTAVSSLAQSVATRSKQVITLDPPTGWELQEHTFDSQGNRLPEAPANFRRLGEAKAGEIGSIHTLTLRFAEATTVGHIKSTKDFRIEQGGSCVDGGKYEANATCTLLVRFTPQGPGNRLGHIVITSASPSAATSSVSGSGEILAAFGIGGNGYSPVINFIPSLITTLPGSYPANVGLLNGAQNLAVDGGDTLWVSDTGNNVVRNYDSSGKFVTLASGYSAPWGITVDTFGEAYFSRPAANTLQEIYDYGPIVTINGAGTGACTASTPCTLSSHTVTKPGELSMDLYNHMFFTEETEGGAFSTVQPLAPNLIFLYDPFPYQTVTQGPAAMDAGDNIYSFWTTAGNCQIVQQSLYNAENSFVAFNKIAGGHTCGFSGDGGLAGNAEIGTSIGQFAFDAAGDMYFSDSANQRVRRIDYTTGVIHTIAGNGTAGYTGDGGGSRAAELNNPTGVAVDSSGAVYIISNSAATGTAQVIRKVGPQGVLGFGNVGKGTASGVQIVTVTNTGNSAMTLTNVAITGPNAADFKVDNTTGTTCLLTAGSLLYAGQTCKIGVTLKPSGTGLRTATLTLVDNTINGNDSVSMSGLGTLPNATLKITAPANGASFTSGTAVTFSVSVTSASGPQPTGKVQFKVDSANLGSPATLSSTGTASTTVTGLTQTTHTLSFTYAGDSNYSAGGPVSVTITITAAVKIGFVSPLSGQTFASKTNVPLAVTLTGGAPAPTGTVKFSVDGNSVGAGTIVAGKAAVNTWIPTAGSHTVMAAYSGDKSHSAANASEKITVSP